MTISTRAELDEVVDGEVVDAEIVDDEAAVSRRPQWCRSS